MGMLRKLNAEFGDDALRATRAQKLGISPMYISSIVRGWCRRSRVDLWSRDAPFEEGPLLLVVVLQAVGMKAFTVVVGDTTEQKRVS